MSRFKKTVSVIMALIITAGVCTAYSGVSAAKAINGIKILSLPVKTELAQNEDWIYGVWETSETVPGTVELIPSDKISFTHNPGSGIYSDRGMLDMTGLVIEVSYTDGTTATMNYKETLGKNGFYTANILVSPKGGKDYHIGTNTMEVYLAANTKYYDSFDVELVEGEMPEEYLKSNNAYIDYNARYIYGLKTNLTLSELSNNYFDPGNGSIVFTKAVRASKFYGTGSTVTYIDSKGNETTYTIVIFGDADGNGCVNYADVSILSAAVYDPSTLSAVQKFALELDGRKRLTASDLSILLVAVSENELDQSSFIK